MTSSISVVLPTYRIGGLDVSFSGLGNQTFKDYEVILVDALYGRRRQVVVEYAQEKGVPLIHIPPKKDTLPLHAPNNFENTGILQSSGELIIILGDYQYAPNNWLQRHWDAYMQDKQTIFTSGLDIYDHPPIKEGINEVLNPSAYYAFLDFNYCPEINDKVMITVFKEEFKPEMLRNLPLLIPDARGSVPQHPHWSWVILKNDSIPIKALEAVNGLDESLDFGSGYQDTDFAFRVLKAEYKLFFDPSNKVFQVNHRSIIPPLKRLWNSNENEAKVQQKIKLIEEGKESYFAPNDFNLREERRKLHG